MKHSAIQKLVDEAYEKSLVEAFPDPKRRAAARWLFDIRNKAVTHRLVTGRDPTDEDLRAFATGAKSAD